MSPCRRVFATGLRPTAIVLAAVSALTLLASACSSPPPRLATVSVGEAQPAQTLIRDVSVFDGTGLHLNQDVLVSGPTVAAMAPTGEVDVPPGAMVLDGVGLTLLPGLIDSHTHLLSAGEKHPPAPSPAAIQQAFLYAGVTTILVTAGMDEVTAFGRERGDETVLGPRVFTAGTSLSAPGGHPAPLLRAMLPLPARWFALRSIATAVDGAEARERVGDIIEEYEPHFVKIIYDDLPPGSSHLTLGALQGAIAEANARGRRAIVHTTTPIDTLRALDAGAALLAHVPQRGRLTDEQAQQIAATGVPLATTVRLVSASYQLAAEGPTALEEELYDPALLQPWRDDPAWNLPGFSEQIDQMHDQAAADTAANLRALAAAGASLLVGTDSGVHGVFPGGALHREMRLLVDLGMEPADVLRAATSAPAAFLDPEGRFGQIAAGWRADLLLVRGDPTADIDALSQIEAIWLNGVRLERHGR